MTINQIVGAVSNLVAAAREQAAEAAGRSYGAEREYAKALNDEFGGLSVAWFTVEHNDKGAEANIVHSEKALYFKALHAKHPAGKYPNPSVPWARVRKYAQEELKAAFDTVEGEGGEGEGEGGEDADGGDGARDEDGGERSDIFCAQGARVHGEAVYETGG